MPERQILFSKSHDWFRAGWLLIMFSHMPGLCDETETMGPRAANSSFMTDNIQYMHCQTKSVKVWCSARETRVQKRKMSYCVITLLCITTMQKSLLWTCLKIKLDILHTFMNSDRPLCPNESVALTLIMRHKCVYVCVCECVWESHSDLCVTANRWNGGKWLLVEP